AATDVKTLTKITAPETVATRNHATSIGPNERPRRDAATATTTSPTTPSASTEKRIDSRSTWRKPFSGRRSTRSNCPSITNRSPNSKRFIDTVEKRLHGTIEKP